jgi:hypothetical protein
MSENYDCWQRKLDARLLKMVMKKSHNRSLREKERAERERVEGERWQREREGEAEREREVERG